MNDTPTPTVDDIEETKSRYERVELYRFKIAEHVGLLLSLGSKDVVNNEADRHVYQRAVNMLEIGLSPITGFRPWLGPGESDEGLVYKDILENIKSKPLDTVSLFDFKAALLMHQLPQLGLLPVKKMSDEDLGTDDEVREFLQWKFRKEKSK